MTQEDNFDDIRPYRDEEVKEVLHRLGKSDQLMSSIRTVFLPKIPKFLGPLADKAVRFYLHKKLQNMNTVDQFQKKVSIDTLLHPIVKKSISGLSYSGLEHLDRDKAYVFITNHRDIVLDPALLNYILTKNGFSFAQIAIGDNLLVHEVVTDIIRLNRAFIVKRNLPFRQQFEESLRLSKYIQHVLDNGESLWIAQKAGRSKDGIDTTNPAVLKMLYFSKRKEKVPFNEFVNNIHIVPVSISYEYDPCDRIKAWEVYRKRTHGVHNKRKYEDLISILAGLKGFKGKVHYSFNEPIRGEFKDDKALAEVIDKKIQSGYKLWPTNFIAYDEVHNTDLFAQSYSQFEKQRFFLRFRRLSDEVRKVLLESYANPVINKMSTNQRV
ncbi:MAG: 1-acyl-sn-glycerol-3-phosphate acyltransferase [Spirochaetaceae bacterium]